MRNISKIVLGLALSALLLALCVTAEAQPEKVYRIGYLSHRSGVGPNEKAFREALRQLGYVEAKNLLIEWRFAKGNLDRHPELAAELVRLKVDCIITVGRSPTQAAKQATSTIPIVMGNVSDDPIRHGLVASLARPGGNITGFTDIAPDLAGKRLELLKETVPKAARVAILWYPNPVSTTQFKQTEIAARPLRVQLQSLKVRRSDDLENAFQAANNQHADALIVVSFGGVINWQERIVNLATKNRLPTMYTISQFVHAGGLMSYAPDGPDRLRRAAVYVDKILKGTKPADLPVQQPAKFELLINLKGAEQIGVTIPANVLARADKVIR